MESKPLIFRDLQLDSAVCCRWKLHCPWTAIFTCSRHDKTED